MSISRNINPPAIIRAAEDPDAIAINAEHEAGMKAQKKSLEHYRKCGEMLLKKKASLKHGEWGKWLKANVGFSHRMANRYMQFAEIKLEPGSNLEEAWASTRSGNTPKEEPENEEQEEEEEIEDKEKEKETEHYEAPVREEDNSRWTNLSNDVQEKVKQGAVSVEQANAMYDHKRRTNLSLAPPQSPSAEPKPDRGRLGRKVGEVVTLEEWNQLDSQKRLEILSRTGSSEFTPQATDSIEWALWSWNPVTGCRHDCPYCYARDIANRLYESKFEPALWPNRLSAPTNTNFPKEKAEEWMGHKNVFVCSMADLFGRWVPADWINAVLKSCAQSTQWNFLFLTKFPNRMSEFVFSDNCWVGTTVDCQVRVKNAEKSFRKVRAKVKWLSCEPLLEPLRFTDLGAFQWVVIGGASSSSKTPKWVPPFRWVSGLELAARQAGCKVYFKTNLEIETRIREYPGVDFVSEKVPDKLIYLPQEIG